MCRRWRPRRRRAARHDTFDRDRTIQFNGEPPFPIVLSPGPSFGSKTPWGTDGLAETTSAGVNVYRTGPGGG